MDNEFKSPLPKKVKQKDEENPIEEHPSNYNNVKKVLCHNVELDESFEQIIKESHLIQRNSMFNIKFALPERDNSDLKQIYTDLKSGVENLKHFSQNQKQIHIRQICNHVEALKLLKEKQLCPISQVIDNIEFV